MAEENRWFVEMHEENVLALVLDKMSGDGSPWYQEQGRHSIPGGLPGEFLIPYEQQPKGMEDIAQAIGLEAIAAALRVGTWQLNRLRKAKYKEYDPGIARIIVKRNKKWTASYQDLFCALVRGARYKSAMQNRKRRKAMRAAGSAADAVRVLV